MAQAKNNFLSSKMNKDLEQRLVPNNEYRDANNVMISRSEGDDVGSLEVVLGNIDITNFGYDPSCDVEVIGYHMNETSGKVFVFLTDYWDSSNDQLSNFAFGNSICSIAVYDLNTSTYTKLVEGYWLNFSKTQPILGVNLIEQQYLYWTDNRNQPRKINVQSALVNPATSPTPSYTCEDQISVSTYYPYQTPLLIKQEITNFSITYPQGTNGYSVAKNVSTSGGTGSGLTVDINTVNGTGQITDLSIFNTGTGYTNGDTITINGGSADATFSVTVEWVSTMTNRTSPFLSDGVATNPMFDQDWGGDKNFLKDKFVRFAYRFKYADGEYSLISPFTQDCWVPKQDGYFTGNADEVEAYTSTEVDIMENKINQIDLIIPSPYGEWSEAVQRFKITEIDLIFKRSDITSLNVIETVKVTDPIFLAYNNESILQYSYLSEKPYRTLPEKDLLRVYDKVPVKALTQEFQENRIIYGNFLDKHTPPAKLDYYVSVDKKEDLINSQIRKEYQNHTLKQNRTYQAGIVLSDRYGRQSSVILTEDERSTVFHPYRSGGNLFNGRSYSGGPMGSPNSFSYWDTSATEDNLLGPTTGGVGTYTISDTWPGDELSVTFMNVIQSQKNSSNGEPGIYNPFGKVSYLKIINPGSGYADSSYNNLTSSTGTELDITISTSGGEVTGITIVDPGIDFNTGDVIKLSGGDGLAEIEVLTLEQPNPTGWYSYKIVIKQPENEYYNIYHAGVLNGYIDGEGPNAGKYLDPPQQLGATLEDPTIHFSLHGDNINKVPKDITLLGPTQSIFRTARPSVADDPSYYEFVDTSGTPFSVDPYNEEGQALLKLRDRKRDLDAGSQIRNSAVVLHPRVINYANTGLGPNPFPETVLAPRWNIAQGSKQWYPDSRVTTVTTIATGRELGLWDAAAPSPYNRAPVFYGFQNNPLIAKATLEINKSLPSSNDNWQNELDKYGATGPSPTAGKVIYNIDHAALGAAGSMYVADSKNINTKVKPGSSSEGNQGLDGQGITVNIDQTSTGSDPGNLGTLVLKGTSISNPDSDPNVRGFDDPKFIYPYHVQLQVLAGSEGGYIYLNAEKTDWPGFMLPYLSVHETQPIESKLDIYWETSTEGLVNELNDTILYEDEFLPVSLLPGVASWGEDIVPAADVIPDFSAYSASNDELTDNVTITYLSCVNFEGADVTSQFLAIGATSGNPWQKRVVVSPGTYFLYDAIPLRNKFTFTFNVEAPTPTYDVDGTTTNTQLTIIGTLQNLCPNFTVTADATGGGSDWTQPGGQNCPLIAGSWSGAPYDLGTFSASYVGSLFSMQGFNGSADFTQERVGITFNQAVIEGWIRIYQWSGSAWVEILSDNWWNGSQVGGGGGFWTGYNPVGTYVAVVNKAGTWPTGEYKVEIKCADNVSNSEIITNTSYPNPDYLTFTLT